MRDRVSDAALIAEGKKVCDGRDRGQSRDQLEPTVAKDLNLDLHCGELPQFMGAVDGASC